MTAQDEIRLEPSDEVEPGERRSAPTQSFADYVENWWVGIKSGELGSLPIIVALVLIVLIFGIQDSDFFDAANFVNLMLQMSGIAVLAIGIVFVLLIAEIDLSVAFVSAVAGVVMTLLLRPEDPGLWWPFAVAIAIASTMIIGLIYGLIVTKIGVPSFVVTLAGLLTFSGVVLYLTTDFSTAGTITIQENRIIQIANEFLSDRVGWIIGVIVVGGYATSELLKARSRRRRGLLSKPPLVMLFQIGGLAAVTFVAVWYANTDRGVPLVAVLLLCLLVFWSFVAGRTRFGRHVYAVGGNPEAARRAGIDVDRVRIAVFMINGFMAGVGGIILASRLRSVATNAGGGSLLLDVIAAAVIGGTSLFGGRGRVVAALLGALVIVSVQNGMDLLGLAAGIKFIVTGLVLLAAVTVDALARRGRALAGTR